MPLTRDTITIASRIMLPAYVAFLLYTGAVYVIDPGDRALHSPGLAAARRIMPMWTWGLLFLGLAAVMLAAFATTKRTWFVFALYASAFVFVGWAGVYAAAVFIDDRASLVGPAWALLAACACRASARSLLKGEV